jgi:hypothetical protein
MKKSFFLFAFCIFFYGIANQVIAQTSTDAALKTRTKSNQTNERSSNQDEESLKVKIRTTATGCELVFNQAIVSPRDAASGLPTGKRQHKPFVITKELDKSSPTLANKSSGSGAGKVSMSDLSVTFTSKGRTQKIPVSNNEFSLPSNCPDDDCDLIVSWSWGASNSGTSSRCEVPITVTMVDGACMAIKQKGTGAAHN